MKLRVLALVTVLFVALGSVSAWAQVGVSIGVAPPVLPVVVQPPVPVEGYIWTPGYWAYGPFGYYWVPGAWVAPPGVGLLWTPPYWGFSNGSYAFYDGYWGPTVGFYGGINYGYGYFGSGYWGGRWDGPVFRYNTAVTRVNTSVIRNTFVDRSVLSRQAQGTRASFNGPNGVQAQPTAEEKAAAENAKKAPPTSQQVARREAASKNRDLQASVNKGHPKAEAIKSFDKKQQPAKGTAAAASEKTGNKAANTGAENKRKTEANRANAEARSAAQGENRRTAASREAQIRSTRAGEHANANVRARPEMNQRSRRPETAGPQQQAAARRGEARQQQQGKKKPGKPGQSPQERP